MLGGGLLERTHLNRRAASDGSFRRPVDGGVEVHGLDDPEAAKVFLAFGEWPIGSQDLAVLDVHHGGARRLLQSPRENPSVPFFKHLVEGSDVAVHPQHHVPRRLGLAEDVVDGQQVLVHWV